jgi:hypothetical protein
MVQKSIVTMTPRQALGRVSVNVAPNRAAPSACASSVCAHKAPVDTMDWFESKRIARERQQAAAAFTAARARVSRRQPDMSMTMYLDGVDEALDRLSLLCDAEQENANMLSRKYEHAIQTPRGLQLRASRPAMT